MLVMQDALQKNVGIVVDIHLKKCFQVMRWTDADSPDDIARQVEGWLPEEYWPKVNEVFAGLRQLWKNVENREKILEKANELGIADLVTELCEA